MTTLTPEAVRAIANLAPFTATKAAQKITPILGAIEVAVEAGILTATSTDRYMVGRAVVDLGDSSANLPSTKLPPEFVTALAKTTGHVELKSSETGALTAGYGGGIIYGQEVAGNYPPVGRLVPATEGIAEMDGRPNLNVAHLSRMAKMRHPKGVTPSWTFGTAPTLGGSGNRTGREPVVMTLPEYDSTRYVVLLQPNLPLR